MGKIKISLHHQFLKKAALQKVQKVTPEKSPFNPHSAGSSLKTVVSELLPTYISLSAHIRE